MCCGECEADRTLGVTVAASSHHYVRLRASTVGVRVSARRPSLESKCCRSGASRSWVELTASCELWMAASTSKCAAPLCHQRAQCALMCISECESASRRRSSSQLRHAWHTYIGCWPAVSLIHILRHGSPNSSLLHPPSPPRALPPRAACSACPCLCRLPTPEPSLARRVPFPPRALSAARCDEEQHQSRTRSAGTDAQRQTDTHLRRARYDRREQEP